MQDEKAEQKLEKLQAILRDMGKVAIGYSGGVDSTFLLKVALDTLGAKNVIALTAAGPVYPKHDTIAAKKLATKIGAETIEFPDAAQTNPDFAANPPDRCYHCKKDLFGYIAKQAKAGGIENIIEGSNVDDQSDYRPGHIALKELGVKTPMVQAGLTKDEIRALSKTLGLPTWDRPSFACLASRFPYGTKITPEKLMQVELAENVLIEAGFKQFRVRYHNEVARIEVPAEDIASLADEKLRTKIVEKIKATGFTYVALDLTGYRTGSMNETLPVKDPH